MYDLRPKESAPSLVNFQKMQVDQLKQLLMKAYKEQLATLERIEAEGAQYDRQSEQQIRASLQKKVGRLQTAM